MDISSGSKMPSTSQASGSAGSPLSIRNRRGSIASIAASSLIEKEQLASALDHIHSSASRSESLTTFNDFAPPPKSTAPPENRNSAGDIVQQGFSGLYSRFREAVGVGSSSKRYHEPEEADLGEALSKKPSSDTRTSKHSISSISRSDTGATTATNVSSQQATSSDVASAAVSNVQAEGRTQAPQSTKSSSISLMSGAKSQGSSRQSLPTKATSSVVADPPVISKEDTGRSSLGQVVTEGSAQRSLSRVDLERHLGTPDSPDFYDGMEGKLPPRSQRDDASSTASNEAGKTSSRASGPPIPPIRTRHLRTPSGGSSMLSPDSIRRRPAALDRISRSRSPGGSRDSSTDRGTAVASPINTSAHSSVYHESFSRQSHSQQLRSGNLRIPGTTMSHEGATDQMAQLDRMRRQVLSKEFWMKDDTVNECFLCQTRFTAFNRKHHCRTCGCIFDAKCTTVISGDKFGVNGSLRVCKNCLEVISRRLDGSASEDSGDESSFMPRIFGNNHSKSPSGADRAKTREQDTAGGSEGSEDSRPVSTPMMTIPATRRVRESNRSAAILEIDTPVLSRPGSSRSLKSLAGRPQSSAGHAQGHKRHHSKHGLLGRFKSESEDRAPFRKGVDEEAKKKPKFPAFHDDNIIDPELADYMSDQSSGDEQMSLFATMSTSDLHSTSYDDKSTLGPSMSMNKKHRHRTGEKSVSGVSFVSKTAFDDSSPHTSLISHRRSGRLRNLSNVSSSMHHHLPSPRHKSTVLKGPSASSEFLLPLDHSGPPVTSGDLLKGTVTPKAELNKCSIQHIQKLLRQLLDDAGIPEPILWEEALTPLLMQSTDDVSPDVENRDYMDIRRYVKLKRIPGGKPSDTTYVSGVIFTKNLALKSMPRKISNPRIVLVTFPIEYQRHQQHFMSLQPVIEQEKEYLRVVVQRITNLRPHLLLAEKGVSGVALQYLSEANISVAYNVKHTVIEAVSRCAETEIITSVDMLALPVKVGRCTGFEVRTFVNHDYPGRKKSYIFLSGCRPELGCTIAIRGAKHTVLAQVKHIVEFMVYVVYNLKLESSLLRDESIEPPDSANQSLSNSIQALSESLKSIQSATNVDQPQPSTVSTPTAEPAAKEAPVSTEPQGEEKGQEEAADDGNPSVVDESSQPASELPVAKPIDSDDDQVTQVPDDVPMPTFYSDMVAKYETKILSASPFVKFAQPYLLMKAREQERRLSYLRQLLEHDSFESEEEDTGNQEFQLIKPEMVEQIGQKAPRQMREILRAVHDAEYDKALFNYQTQTRQWETYIQGNLDLFDPYFHQNIVVLYSMICTENKIPCTEPVLLAINFYDDDYVDPAIDPDCTLGHYIEGMVFGRNDLCHSNGCERRMGEHYRSYVHDRARITVFVDQLQQASPRRPELGDGITMWTYCKICKKDSEERAMSELTFKYSFGKYLELLFWGRGLRMKDSTHCGHDHHRDHVRYFGLDDCRVRVHWDPIDLLEIVVPRLRITWKVSHDIKLKNEIYKRMEDRWTRFMSSVKGRLKSIRIDSVLPEKAEECKAELETLAKNAQEDELAMVHRLRDIYVNTKYYEVVPFNGLVKEMLEKAGEWDLAFTKFEADFLGDKDMRQQIMMQLKKMIAENDSKESLASTEGSGSVGDSEEKPSQTFSEADEKSTQPTDYTATASLEASAISTAAKPGDESPPVEEDGRVSIAAEGAIERVDPLDLASSPVTVKSPVELAAPADTDPAPKAPTSPQKPAPRRSLSPTVARKGHTQGTPSSSGQSLTDKVDQKRREQAAQSSQSSESGGVPSTAEEGNTANERAGLRRSGSQVSPPLVRATSHPVRPLPRTQSSLGKPLKDSKTISISGETKNIDQQSMQEGTIRVDKKLSERLGLSVLKNRGKGGQSSIPRLVPKKKESKVSTLARHFEQLSREFEKERIRDRKKRAASLRQPRAMLPRASTKQFVKVYADVQDAFDEPAPAHDHAMGGSDERLTPEDVPKNEDEEDEQNPEQTAPSIAETESPPTESHMGGDVEDASAVQTSQAMSEDDGAASDVEPPEEYLPEIEKIADALEPSTQIPVELPKHQKTSLMKYLTTFWAERSASGWPALEYPINPTDHIFVDSDIIVREDEPSSVIALVLNSEDYQDKLARIRAESHAEMHQGNGPDNDFETASRSAAENAQFELEREMENSLLQPTGTHLKYQFKEGPAVMTCKIFYAEQFDALRRKCGVSERIIESLSRCLKWDSKGGKTKSVFLKTLDDRLVLKSLSPVETSAFLRFAPGYFSIMAEALFHDLPSVIAKMLGFFQVFIKNPLTQTDMKFDLLITENLFYDRSPDRIFDLKGSMRNRRIQSTGEQNEVLLDENMVDFIHESPLFAREHSKKLLRASVWNDTLFLARQNVMDYSLMIAVDENRKELVVGIIDCIRTYTWDKKLESWIKDRGFAGGGRNRPTVTSPKEYKSRFREAMARYILQSPTCWHLFGGPNAPQSHMPRARFEASDHREIDAP